MFHVKQSNGISNIRINKFRNITDCVINYSADFVNKKKNKREQERESL